MEKISEELDYATKINNHSTVSWRDIAPQNSSDISLSDASPTGPSEFIISPVVMNMADSRLEFRLEVASTNGRQNVIDADLLSLISRVVLYDSGTNALLCDINNFDKYNDMLKYNVCSEDLKSKPKYGRVPPSTLDDAKITIREDKTLHYENTEFSITSATDTITQTATNVLYGRGSNGRANAVGTGAQDVTTLEPHQGILFTYVGANATASVLDVSIPLKSFVGTILSQDNAIYNPTNLVLQIYWNAKNQFGGTVANGALLTGLPTNSLGASVIKSLNLVLATEANTEIISRVISKVMSEGISFNAPYPSVVKHSVSANSINHAFTIQLTRAYGNRLLYLMTARYEPTTAGINNHSQGDLERYNTTLNSVPMKYPRGFDVKAGDDYTLGNKVFIEGSCISHPYLYRQKWVHIDSFFGDKKLCDIDYNDIDGLDVSSQSSVFGWEASFTNGKAGDYYVIIMGHKQISFTSMGATIQ